MARNVFIIGTQSVPHIGDFIVQLLLDSTKTNKVTIPIFINQSVTSVKAKNLAMFIKIK